VSIHGCPQRSGLPEAVPVVPEFCDAALPVNPHQVGKPLPGPLADRHGARHGTYRVVNRIAENGSIVTSSTSATARRFPAASRPLVQIWLSRTQPGRWACKPARRS
jgi:hypothetical protein